MFHRDEVKIPPRLEVQLEVGDGQGSFDGFWIGKWTEIGHISITVINDFALHDEQLQIPAVHGDVGNRVAIGCSTIPAVQ